MAKPMKYRKAGTFFGILAGSIFAMALSAKSAPADDWIHSAASMGQFEGTWSDDVAGVAISYGCSGLSSSVNFMADGLHVAAGKSLIEIDGEQVFEGNTTYNSLRDKTGVSSRVEARWGERQKSAHNAIINGLASGSEAVWTTPSGDVFQIDLTGSSEIRNCVMQ